MKEHDLVMRMRQVEADLAPAPTPLADGQPGPDARQRIAMRREAIEQTDPPMEHHFQVKDAAERRLLAALLRRYGLTPYRYPRQGENDLMVRMSLSFEDELLHPIRAALQREWAAFRLAAMERVAAEALHWDTSDPGRSVDDVPRTVGRR